MLDPSIWLGLLVSMGIQDIVQPYNIIKDFQKELDNQIVIERTLDDLMMCESGGDTDALNENDGKIGSHSYGIFQFKKSTWWEQTRKYGYYQNLEENEIENAIYDRETQRNLTRNMIRDGGACHWENCAVKIGLITKEYCK